METLEELPIEKWPLLQEKLKQKWILNIPGYYALYLNMKYPNVKEAFQFKVYCPKGNMANGFISVNTKDNNATQDVIIFSCTEDTSELEEALINTQLINWSQPVCVDLVNSLIVKSFNRVHQKMKFKKYDVGRVKTFFLTKEAQPFVNLGTPPNITLASVREEHIERIDSVWPYKYPGSEFYFATFIRNNLSYGVYLGNQLVAWVFINEYNFLLHLYCEEEHRRAGYAEFLLKNVINEQLKVSNDMYAYVVDGNEKPMKLLTKLGFEVIDDGAYIFVQK